MILSSSAGVHYTFLAGCINIVVLYLLPNLRRKLHMLPNDSLGPFVIQNQTLSDMSKLGGGGKLSAIGTSVAHEGRIGGGLPVLGPEISRDTSGGDLTDVIQRQFNGYAAEEIVKEHSVGDVTPGRLEEKMNMSYLIGHRDC
jgi:hypothetical protein